MRVRQAYVVRRAHFDIIQAMPETTIKNPRTEDCARIALDEASAKLASDVVLLDLREATDFTDYFVIASGETDRHIESIAEDLRRKLRSMGVRLVGREGTGKGGWILLDFGGFYRSPVYAFRAGQVQPGKVVGPRA